MIIKVNVKHWPIVLNNRILNAQNYLHLYRQLARLLSLHPAHNFSQEREVILFNGIPLGTHTIIDSKTILTTHGTPLSEPLETKEQANTPTQFPEAETKRKQELDDLINQANEVIGDTPYPQPDEAKPNFFKRIWNKILSFFN